MPESKESVIGWGNLILGAALIGLAWWYFLTAEEYRGLLGHSIGPRFKGVPPCFFYPAFAGFNIYGLYLIGSGLRGKPVDL